MAVNNAYRAVSKYLIASPFKVRPVADLIRRKPYTEALSILESMPHKGARLIRKTMKSAAANALNANKQLAEDMLYVKDVQIDFDTKTATVAIEEGKFDPDAALAALTDRFAQATLTKVAGDKPQNAEPAVH